MLKSNKEVEKIKDLNKETFFIFLFIIKYTVVVFLFLGVAAPNQ